jgi:hypothetical protein
MVWRSGADLHSDKLGLSFLAEVATKPAGRMRAIPQFSEHFVVGVKSLSDVDWIKLVRVIPGEALLFGWLA